MALLNCFLYTWYGLPVVSYKWENFHVVTINGLGILLELYFILIYFHFASTSGKKKVAMMTIPFVLVSCTVALISAFVFDDHGRRKAFVGSIGLVASVAMYGSPLVVMKQVIESKSVEFWNKCLIMTATSATTPPAPPLLHAPQCTQSPPILPLCSKLPLTLNKWN
ncbi:hypothetical protein ACS0TY_026619 [Phlomoides rotata]